MHVSGRSWAGAAKNTFYLILCLYEALTRSWRFGLLKSGNDVVCICVLLASSDLSA